MFANIFANNGSFSWNIKRNVLSSYLMFYVLLFSTIVTMIFSLTKRDGMCSISIIHFDLKKVNDAHLFPLVTLPFLTQNDPKEYENFEKKLGN